MIKRPWHAARILLCNVVGVNVNCRHDCFAYFAVRLLPSLTSGRLAHRLPSNPATRHRAELA